MMNEHDEQLLDPDVLDLVRAAAAKLARSARFHRQDVSDLEQTLLLKLLEAVPCYDAARADWLPFASTVVASKARNLYRDAGAARRAGRPVSLSMLNSEADGIDELAVVGEQAHADLALDVATRLGSASPELRAVAEMFKQSHTRVNTAMALGISAEVLRRRVRCLQTLLDDLEPIDFQNPPTS